MIGPTIVAVGTEAAEAALPAGDPRRRRDLVPGLQRARRRLRPGQRAHPGAPRRRPLGRRRPEDLDDVRPSRRLDLRAVPHQPRRAEAPRPLDAPGADAPTRRRGTAASATSRARPSSAKCSSTARAPTPTSSSVTSTTAGASRCTVLGFERATATLPHQMQFEREVDDLIAHARRTGRGARRVASETGSPTRGSAYGSWGSTTRDRSRPSCAHGTPGPESSIAKLYWSEWHQRLCELKLDVLGADALLYDYLDDDFERDATHLPAVTRRDDLRREQPDPAQHDRRACARPPERAAPVAGPSSGSAVWDAAPTSGRPAARRPGCRSARTSSRARCSRSS